MEDYWFWVSLCWALWFCAWLWSRKIDREVKAIEKDVTDILSKVLFMRIEEHDGRFFAYNAMTNEFVCQGVNMEELNLNFGKRYPERRGVLIEAEGTKSVL